MKLNELVRAHREEILALARKHRVSDVRMFGSAARGNDRDESDIDFMVKRDSDNDPFELIELKASLEALLGRRVDLMTEHPGMRVRLRESIERDLVPV